VAANSEYPLGSTGGAAFIHESVASYRIVLRAHVEAFYIFDSNGRLVDLRFYVRDPRAAFTRSGVNGTSRMRTPVASKMALPIAAATTVIEVSPVPQASSSG
jgi:hypothetical protein